MGNVSKHYQTGTEHPKILQVQMQEADMELCWPFHL